MNTFTFYPVAALGDQILIVNEGDVSFIGKERAMEVMCVQVDLRHKTIYPTIELEKHLKFNPWVEVSDAERGLFVEKVKQAFSDGEISENIVEPLAAVLVR